jgi:nicotinamidase-related amidase
MPDTLTLRFRQQRLERDENGYQAWKVHERTVALVAEETALVLCDVWDRNWCRGANERLEEMLPRINAVAKLAREKGALIVHAPSDTMDFYKDSPARERVLQAPPAEPPEELLHRDQDPSQPVDASDGGCDTDDNVGAVHEMVWTRQHPTIEIDHARDVISDDGRELYNLYQQRNIRNVIILGVHANMCILNRSFAIKQMVRWGFTVALVRDLTDCLYNPARPPYVSHDEATRLTVAFIEKFWCPTIGSEDLRYACGGEAG